MVPGVSPTPRKPRKRKKRTTELNSNLLWQFYLKGFHCLNRNGSYFRQLLRPAFSRTYFERAVPILRAYAVANQNEDDLPPGFGDQMQACPLSFRDLLHLDYSICLGYAELRKNRKQKDLKSVMEWPGPTGYGGVFIASDAILNPTMDLEEDLFDDDDDFDDPDEDGRNEPPFDI